jgi:steroid 5-alpha reductase family enzyme
LLAVHNPEPALTTIELAATGLWLFAFAAETTTDRQLLRFRSKPEHEGLPCRTGLWRVTPRAHAWCEALIWTAFALFASASPWGWIAWSCPAAMIYLLFAVRRRC